MKTFLPRLIRVTLAIAAMASVAGAQQKAAQKPATPPPPPPPAAPSDGIDRIEVQVVKRMLDSGAPILILDVRAYPDSDTTTKRVKGCRHISVNELEARIKDVPADREIITYCS